MSPTLYSSEKWTTFNRKCIDYFHEIFPFTPKKRSVLNRSTVEFKARILEYGWPEHLTWAGCWKPCSLIYHIGTISILGYDWLNAVINVKGMPVDEVLDGGLGVCEITVLKIGSGCANLQYTYIHTYSNNNNYLKIYSVKIIWYCDVLTCRCIFVYILNKRNHMFYIITESDLMNLIIKLDMIYLHTQ